MKKTDSIADCITHAIQQYFKNLNGESPQNLHAFFINEVEKPFLVEVMQQVNGNQSEASKLLGINRNTLRKKIKMYDI